MTYQEFDAVIRLPAQTVPLACRDNNQTIEQIERLKAAVEKCDEQYALLHQQMKSDIGRLQAQIAQLSSTMHMTKDVQSELLQLMAFQDKLTELENRIAQQENERTEVVVSDKPASNEERQDTMELDELVDRLPTLAQTKKHTDFVIWFLRLKPHLSPLKHFSPSTQMWLVLHQIEQGSETQGYLISKSCWEDIAKRIPGHALLTGGRPQGFMQTAAPFVTLQDMLEYIGKTCFQINVSHI